MHSSVARFVESTVDSEGNLARPIASILNYGIAGKTVSNV
jgi:hypothetical protein